MFSDAMDDDLNENSLSRSESQIALDMRIEGLVRKMMKPLVGLKQRNQRSFFSASSQPQVHTGKDIINWLMRNIDVTSLEEAEHLSTTLLRLGFIYRMDTENTFETEEDEKSDVDASHAIRTKRRSGSIKNYVKADGDTYRFQDPKYWPGTKGGRPSEADYAIYLLKKASTSKGRQRLSEKEGICLDAMAYSFGASWEMITTVAEEEYRMFKQLKKVERLLQEKQETAYWCIHRPNGPVPHLFNGGEKKFNYDRKENGQMSHSFRSKNKLNLRTKNEELQTEILRLQGRMKARTVGTTAAANSLINAVETYQPFDILIHADTVQSKDNSEQKNRWISEEDFSRKRMTTLRIRKWRVSLHELLNDRDGRRQFEQFVEKEFSGENLKFWLSCEQLKYGPSSKVKSRVAMIYKDFLVSGARYEINIDSATMAITKRNVMTPSRYSYDEAQRQVFSLMSRDSYLRFMKSPQYNRLLQNANLLDEERSPQLKNKSALSKSSISVFFSSRSPRLSLRGTSSTGEPRGAKVYAGRHGLRKTESDDNSAVKDDSHLGKKGKSLSMTDLTQATEDQSTEAAPAGFGSRLRRLTKRGAPWLSASSSPRPSPPPSRMEESEVASDFVDSCATDTHEFPYNGKEIVRKANRSASFADILSTKLSHVQTIQENEALSTGLDDWQWRRISHGFSYQ